MTLSVGSFTSVAGRTGGAHTAAATGFGTLDIPVCGCTSRKPEKSVK